MHFRILFATFCILYIREKKQENKLKERHTEIKRIRSRGRKTLIKEEEDKGMKGEKTSCAGRLTRVIQTDEPSRPIG